MGDKSVETFGSKIRFWSVLVTFSPFPPKTMLIFPFLWPQRPQRLHNIELLHRGLDANKIEQMLKCPKSVSTNLVLTVWRPFMQIVAISFTYPSSSKFILKKWLNTCVV